MTRPNLRDYQLRAIQCIDDAITAGSRSIAIVAPTGSGKTLIAAELARREVSCGGRVIFVAPRRELIHQASRKLDAFGIPHGIILAGDRRHNFFAQVQIASVDTLRARSRRLLLPDPHLVIADEAHLYVTQIRVGLLTQWRDAVRIGLTATPCRKDGRGLGTLFDSMIEVASTADLTAEGHLVPAQYFSIAEPDLKRVHTVAGDYHAGELAEAMSPLVADVPTTWLARAAGRRTVVFAVNVAHSIALQHAFLERGVGAEHVDGGTPNEEREAIFDRFSRGETQVLCNCQIASIGFDLPEVDCIVLARPTKSLAMYLQMLGRGLRPSPGKSNCLVLDHSGCVHSLGFATDVRRWTLDGHADLTATRAIREKAEGREVTCPTCSCVYAGGRVCPSCGHYIAPVGKEIKTLDGELIEVGARLPADRAAQLAFFLELRGYGIEKHFKPGWAARKFKEKHGTFPPWPWNDLPAATPSVETLRWVQSRFIAARYDRQAMRA
jgi:DNA repair protein RadD